MFDELEQDSNFDTKTVSQPPANEQRSYGGGNNGGQQRQGGYQGGGGGNGGGYSRGGGGGYGGGGGRGFQQKEDVVSDPYLPVVIYVEQEFPDNVKEQLYHIASKLIGKRYTVRVSGIDKQFAERVMKLSDSKVELYLPWRNFNEMESKRTFNTLTAKHVASVNFAGWEKIPDAIKAFLPTDLGIQSDRRCHAVHVADQLLLNLGHVLRRRRRGCRSLFDSLLHSRSRFLFLGLELQSHFHHGSRWVDTQRSLSGRFAAGFSCAGVFRALQLTFVRSAFAFRGSVGLISALLLRLVVHAVCSLLTIVAIFPHDEIPFRLKPRSKTEVLFDNGFRRLLLNVHHRKAVVGTHLDHETRTSGFFGHFGVLRRAVLTPCDNTHGRTVIAITHDRPDMKFFVTRLELGNPKELKTWKIATMFVGCNKNCIFPVQWKPYLK